jgi:hypothetical protein
MLSDLIIILDKFSLCPKRRNFAQSGHCVGWPDSVQPVSLLWTETAHIFWGYFFPRLKLCNNFGRNGLGYILGDFVTSSSGHPVTVSVVNKIREQTFFCFRGPPISAKSGIQEATDVLSFRDSKRSGMRCGAGIRQNFFSKFWPMPLFLLFNTQTMHRKSFHTQQHCYVPLKNFYPGGIRTRVFLFLRRMRCPLRHADRAEFPKTFDTCKIEIRGRFIRRWADQNSEPVKVKRV